MTKPGNVTKKPNSVMGRPTIPIVGEVIPEQAPEVDAKRGTVTVGVHIADGPAHVKDRDMDVEIPLAMFGEITPNVSARDGFRLPAEVVLPKRPQGKRAAAPVAIKIFEVIEGSRETHEVHTSTCPATRSHSDQRPYEDTATSIEDVREMIYPHEAFEYDPTDVAMTSLYDEDISFHACVSKKLSQ